MEAFPLQAALQVVQEGLPEELLEGPPEELLAVLSTLTPELSVESLEEFWRESVAPINSWRHVSPRTFLAHLMELID